MKLKNNIFYTLSFSLFLLIGQVSYAQSSGYINHTIKSGETLSALASKYKTSVGDIMRLNGMNSKSILRLGERIKIPSNTKSTAVQSTAKPQQTASTPPINAQTHTVKKGESLYKISKDYNLTQAQLMQMNNLSNHNLKVGQVLVVGGQSNAIASSNTKRQDVSTPPARVEKADTTTPTNQPDADPFTLENKSPVKETPIETPKETPVQPSVAPKVETANSKPIEATDTRVNAPEGYFASEFGMEVEGRSLQSKTGTAMSFKTASGWADKKYYILMNDVPPGSIVKIASSDKVIYAKVLWNLGDIKENEGLDFRISNAAASALGISDPKFQVTVSYFE